MMKKSKLFSLLALILAFMVFTTSCDIFKPKKEAVKWTVEKENYNPDLELWVTDSLDRVRKNRPSNGTYTIELCGAKGEYESFQIVACTDSKKSIKLTGLTLSDFISEDGSVISSDYITIYREHYIKSTVSSPKSSSVIQELTGEIPDALIPVVSPLNNEPLGTEARFYAFPYTLTKEACQPFFIDIEIPKNAKAGLYTATYEMQSDGGLQGGEVTLRVWDITLSETLSQGSFFLSRSAKSEQKAEEAAKHKMFSYAMNEAQEKQLTKRYGYNNANLGFWSGASLYNPIMKAAPSVDSVKKEIAKHNSNLNLFNYSADEISGAPQLHGQIKEYAQALHKAGTKQLITMPPTEDLLDDGLGTGQAAVDIWVVMAKQYDSEIELIKKAKEKGCEIWTYTCMVQDSYAPKYLLDYPLLNHRIQPGFINYSLKSDGFLFWCIDNWTTVSDPWVSLDMTYNGDGILFYPGDDVGLYNTFVPSLRAKAIRDGFEDYGLCAAIKKKGGKVGEYISKIASDFSNWTQDKDVLLAERKNLGNTIIKK